MDTCAFDAFLMQIADLTRAQCTRVLALLTATVTQGRAADVIEEAAAATLVLPAVPRQAAVPAWDEKWPAALSVP